ncbi:ArnT family glycosyltransferase [Candidatus Margulisiibacteriota bacterium]
MHDVIILCSLGSWFTPVAPESKVVDLINSAVYNAFTVKLSSVQRGLVIVLAATILIGGVIFVNRILAGDAFTYEEAQHALYGMWLTRDVKTLDWGTFWYDTHRQMAWPFLHSWLQSLFFLVFGVGYVSARLLSLVLFMATVVMMYFFSNQVCGKSGWKIGILACALALTSPIMLRFASENMLEGLGAFLFLAAAYTYTVCEERKITLEYVFLALLIGLSMYTNYLYAYLILPAFIMGTIIKLWPLALEAVELRLQGEEKAVRFIWWGYRKLIVMAVLLFLGGLWFSFSYSRKILLLYSSIFKYSGGVATEGLWQTLVYYPGVIVEKLTFSPWLGLLLLLSLFLPFVSNAYRWINKLFIYVWTVLLLLAFTIPAKAPQLLYIITPFILIIFSAVVFFVIDKVEAIKGQNKRWQEIMLLVLILPSLIALPSLYGRLFPNQPPENLIDVLKFFQAKVPQSASMALPVHLERLNPEVVNFHFRDWQGAVLSDPQLSEEELYEGADYILCLEVDRGSFYQSAVTDASLFRWNALAAEKEMSGQIQPDAIQRFESIGVTAKVYRKISM